MRNFSQLTDKQGLLVWGGESSTDYGMVVSEAPSFDKPAKRQEVFTVPGRNGSIVFEDGSYNDTVRSYHIWIDEDEEEDSGGNVSGTLAERVNALTEWLFSKSGYTRLEDNFEPEVYRLAYYSGANDITNELTMYGETDLTFTCRPERFLKSGETAVAVVNGDTLTNPTKFSSKPLIKITAAGTVTVTISGVSIVAVVSDYIYIDCEAMNAYRLTTENRNDKISGSFPVIKPGINPVAVSVTGTLTKVEVTPRYFTI